MKTMFGGKVTLLESTGNGWVKVRREKGDVREWHIADLRLEGDESPRETAIIDAAYAASATPD